MILSKTEFTNLRREIETALGPIAAKYGCAVKTGNIKYDEITADIMVSFRTETEEKSAEQFNFEKHAPYYGFKPEDFGFAFSHNGKFFKFVSFKTTARKYPCICDCSDGKQYAYEVDAMLEIMRRERTKA